MRTFKIFALMVAATGMIFSSCQNDSDISSKTDSSLGVQLQAVNNTYSFGSNTKAVTAGTLKWDTCQMYVSRVHLSAKQSQGDSIHSSFETELKFKGSKLVDLFNASSLLGNIDLQPGIYDKITIQIQSNKKDAGNSPVFYLSGNYTNASGTITPIALIVNKDLKFIATAKDSVQLNSADDYTNMLQLDLSEFMSNGNILKLDFDKATLTNGKIIISEDSNADLYKKFYKRVSLINAFKHAAFKKLNNKH